MYTNKLRRRELVVISEDWYHWYIGIYELISFSFFE